MYDGTGPMPMSKMSRLPSTSNQSDKSNMHAACRCSASVEPSASPAAITATPKAPRAAALLAVAAEPAASPSFGDKPLPPAKANAAKGFLFAARHFCAKRRQASVPGATLKGWSHLRAPFGVSPSAIGSPPLNVAPPDGETPTQLKSAQSMAEAGAAALPSGTLPSKRGMPRNMSFGPDTAPAEAFMAACSAPAAGTPLRRMMPAVPFSVSAVSL
mmetsp:Transcript_167502/g.537900  ORF Transcript_167502/g.537900 Transcript_167502/m.537900 type:complete len:215 (+) Transcript_167502:283-927(+)